MRGALAALVAAALGCGGPGTTAPDPAPDPAPESRQPATAAPEVDTHRDTAASGAAAFDTSAMSGPADSLDALCNALPPGLECGDRNTAPVPPAPRPYLDVQTLDLIDGDSGVGYCDVAVRTERGWFSTVQHLVCNVESPRSGGRVTGVSYVPTGAGAPVIVVSAGSDGGDGRVVYEEKTVSLCGIGASDVPSCTAPIVTYRYETDDDGAEHEHELSVDVRADGTVHLSGELDGEIVDRPAALSF